MRTEPRPEIRREPGPGRVLAWTLLALLPALAAVVAVPWFVTQDGPEHTYNAHILVESMRGGSPFRDAFAVRWEPLPNWAGHLALMALVALLPGWAADRAMTAGTLLALSLAAAWLWWRVAGGGRGASRAAALAGLVGLNVAWLLGFNGFLLGAALFPVTLGVWWSGRDRLGPGRLAALAALLVAGYFCHLVSLGLTALGLIVLAVATPGPGVGRRVGRTAAALVVLAPLGAIYRRLARQGGPLRPTWDYLLRPLDPVAWREQLFWADPLTLGRKHLVPFLGGEARWGVLLVPTLWVVAALTLLALSTLRADPARRRERRGWLALAALLIVGGFLGPDSLGDEHGQYLPQRVILLGLVALLPALELGGTRPLDRVGGALLWAALGLQTAFVWDYGRRSDRTAGELLRVAAPAIGRGQRVGTLLIDLRGSYRANPLLHVDGLLGVGTGNVMWTNYEAAHYYFPVRFRPGAGAPPPGEFERVSKLDDPGDAGRRLARWRRLLERHEGQVDRLVIRGSDPGLEAVAARWFEPSAGSGAVRVWRHRGGSAAERR